MDITGQAIVDFLFSCVQDSPPALVNLVHPRPVVAQLIWDGITEALGRSDLPCVPYDEWFTKLESIAERATEQDFHKIVCQSRRSECLHDVLTCAHVSARTEGDGFHAPR